MKKISILLSIFGLISIQKINAQSFAGLYTFTNVTTSSGIIDPTPAPTATGLTFGSFSAYGTPVNPNSTLRFNFQNWPTGATNANDNYSSLTGSLSTGEYYEVTLSPAVGYSIALNGITFTTQRSSTGMRTYSVRSSLDGYASDLPASINPSNANLSVQTGNIFFWNFDATITAQNGNTITLGPAFSNLTAPVTFRFYGWNTESSVGNFSIDNVTFGGTATALQILAAFTASPGAICVGLPVSFSDNTQSFNGPVTTWSWDFNDLSSGPNNVSTLQNPTHTFVGCGPHLVQLIASNSNNNIDTAQNAESIYCNPVAMFSGTPTSGCAPVCVNFIDNSTGSPTAWSWDFGDLATGNIQNPIHCYSNSGIYSATLIVTNSFGCSGTVTMNNYVTVNAFPATSFSSSVAGNVATFTNTTTGNGPFTYSWNFGDGSPVNNSANPVHTYLIDGTYTVCLVADQNGCRDSICNTVVIFTTGIAQQNLNSETSIYPNPSASGVLNLDVKQNYVLSVYDLVGNEIRKKEKINSGTTTLDLHDLSNGTYFLKLENEKSSITKKISIAK